MKKTAHSKKLFILDTNVLMHDPSALFRFQEHDIFLPMVVLEELDRGKKGTSEVARNVRQASRFLADIMGTASGETIANGMPIQAQDNESHPNPRTGGKLYFQTSTLEIDLPSSLPGLSADNTILGTSLALYHDFPDHAITLVTKDINLRIKARILGIPAEDYHNDQVLDDVDLLFSGMETLPADFWDRHAKHIESWQDDGRTFYRLSGPDVSRWVPNQCLMLENNDGFPMIVRTVKKDHATIELASDFINSKHAVWGVQARNPEQNFALNLLLDPNIDLVTLLGAAGTGKTLLTLAAGLRQTLEDNRFKEIIMTRVTVSVGEDIGFLPGTEEEKMTPWMGALMDNLEVLTHTESGGEWGQQATYDLLRNRIKIRSLNFMRGRTFLNRFVIIDEAQNLTSKQIKTLITRAGPGSKIVLLGNVAQIDTPYLTETTSGLTYAVDRFKKWAHSGHIILRRGERSRLADFASDHL